MGREGNLSKVVWGAFVVALIAAVMLGMVIGNKINSSTTSSPGTADVTLVVQADLKLGPDGNLHDAFVPCNFTVYAGQVVDLTFINYDDMSHSFNSSSLNVNFMLPPSSQEGVPSVSHFQFTETVPGIYRWHCSTPCDTDSGGWAMTTGTDGQPDQIGFMAGFVTVLQR